MKYTFFHLIKLMKFQKIQRKDNNEKFT